MNGNLSIQAGDTLHVTGSDLVAAQNVTGIAANVVIDAATDTTHQAQTQQTSSSGVTLGLSGSVGDALNNAISQTEATRNAADGNGRAAALHAIAAGGDAALAGYGAAQLASGTSSANAPSLGVQVSVGSSHTSSQSSEDQTIQRGSSVQAGGAAAFVATGDGTAGSGNVTIVGSNVSANDVLLAAKNQVNLVNTTNTDVTQSSNSSSGSSVGVSIGTNGLGVSASMQQAHGDGNSSAATQNNTQISGANNVVIVSGGDTNIVGSNVNGATMAASVGGNLNIESVQDTTVSSAHQSSTGGGFSVSETGGSASFTAQNGHADATYAGVNQQAGIQAGAGGFDIHVDGNTDLADAVISSTAEASKNSVTTGTITFGDIQNQSHYSASSDGLSAGAGVGNTGKAIGMGSVSNSGGGAPMMSQDANGDQSATTHSAISAGAINITNGGSQTQDVANLSRDTIDANGTVSQTPDVQNILSQQADTMQATQAAGQVVSQGIGAYADGKRDEAVAQAKVDAANGDTNAVAADAAEAKQWMEGGDSRAELQAAGGALIGGLGGGSVFTAVGGALGAGLASKLADPTKAAADAVTDATGSSLLGSIGGNLLAGVGGALVGGTAGAAAASNVDLYNRNNDAGNAKAKADLAAAESQAQNVVAQWLQTNLPASITGPLGDANEDLNRAVAQFLANLRAHARDKMSQPPVVLMAQGVANGLNAILDPGLGGPPTLNGGGVLVNSAGQAVSPIFSGMPSNVMSSSKEDEGDVFTSPQGSNAGSGAEGQQPTSSSAGLGDILVPNGEPVGYVYLGAGPGIRTVTSEQFGQLQSQLMKGAKPVATPSGYAGVWYQMLDGSVFGIRKSDGSGTTIDVIKSNNPSLPSGFKVHKQ